MDFLVEENCWSGKIRCSRIKFRLNMRKILIKSIIVFFFLRGVIVSKWVGFYSLWGLSRWGFGLFGDTLSLCIKGVR